MTHSATTHLNPPLTKSEFWISFGRAVAAGLVGGILVAILDLTQSVKWVTGMWPLTQLILQVVSRLALIGAAVGGIGFVLAACGRWIAWKSGLSPRWVVPAFFTMALLPGAIAVGIKLFQGGFTSRLPAKPVWITLVIVLLALLVFGLSRVALWLLYRSAASRQRRWNFGIIAAAVVAAAMGLWWCDAALYKRLYPYLHSVLAFGTLSGFVFGIHLLMFRKPSSGRSRYFSSIGFGVFTLMAAWFQWGAITPQTVKSAMYEHTATLANVLKLLDDSADSAPSMKMSAAARRQRYERERRARLAAAKGDFPVFPGAHLVIVSVDALRADRLGTYGYQKRRLSPNIDKWANGSTVFEHAYCSAPHSSYSITSFHTSRYTHVEGMLGRTIAHRTLADVLKDKGYETAAYYTQGIFFTEGERVEHYKDNKFGFKKVVHGAPPPAELTDQAILQIDQYIDKGEPPFFMWVHYFNVHEPYKASTYGNSPSDRYDSEIAIADKEIARLLGHMETKLARDVIVVFTADHGEEFKDHGGHYHGSSLYEEQTRIPFILRVPGADPTRIHHPVSMVDLAPTVLRLLDVTTEPGMQGQDLRPAIFQGNDAHVAQPVFSSVMKQHMAVQWPWKLVADPSRGLYKLFHLEKDSKELVNRYDSHKDIAEEMLQEIYGWLDDIGRGEDAAKTALNLGRMRDKRAIPGLLTVAENTGAPLADRVEALQLLGDIRAWNDKQRLIRLLDDSQSLVSTYAALALAAIDVPKGKYILKEALYDDNPTVRDEAAMALAKLGDNAAVPLLIEALGRVEQSTREMAIRYLGQLGDPRATEPLIATLSEMRTRYLSVLALGQIGDPRAYAPIMNVLESEKHTDIRGYAVVALGWMKNSEALSRLMRVLVEEPEIKWTTEALVRLGAIREGYVYGTDAAPGQKELKGGFGPCVRKKRVISDEFMGQTTCQSNGAEGTLQFTTNEMGGGDVYIRVRHLSPDNTERLPLTIAANGKVLSKVELGSTMEEYRVPVTGDVFSAGKNTVKLTMESNNRFELDHFLVYPNTSK